MDVSFVIRQRLEEFGLEQRELARAAQVTESYISQLLTRQKAPPAPNRTDIYDKMDKFLKLPSGELARLADRPAEGGTEARVGGGARALVSGSPRADPPQVPPRQSSARPRDLREAALRRARAPGHPDGCWTWSKGVAKEELENEYWLRMVADLGGRSFEEMRVIVLEFLDTDIFHLSREHCVSFLDPLIESWDIDLATFALDIVLNPRVVSGHVKRFEFIEREADQLFVEEPGLTEFLRDSSLSGTASAEEVEFLKRLRFKGKRPTPLYYYRELQNLRDPLHFSAP